jgi:DNA repair and recombination protein RAD52
MFDQKQITQLQSELDTNRIKSRNKGNINLSYLEGFDIIETANRIFGYGNWDYNISKLEQVSSEVNQNQNNVICYKAVVQLTIYSYDHIQKIVREDVGFGSGTAKALADAHEGGAKEAVTDALKRALRSFGNQFGNSLYSKDKNHNGNNQHYQNQSQNHNQSANNNYQQNQSMQNGTPYRNQQDFQQLTNLGLQVMQQGDYLIATGQNLYEHRAILKANNFRFNPENKTWYMQLRQAA